LREGGLCKMEPFRGAAKVQLFCNRNKVTQVS
jgi:hypothetical protein